MKKYTSIIALSLIVLIIIARVIPHMPNVAPVAAAALVAGVYLGRKWAVMVPTAGMLFSDLAIGFYKPEVMLAVYGSFALIGLCGIWLQKHKNARNIIATSLAGSVLFYLITNFAVWYASDWYAPTLAGLLLSYEMALPFFRNTLIGDLLYTGVLFATFEFVHQYFKQKKTQLAFEK